MEYKIGINLMTTRGDMVHWETGIRSFKLTLCSGV